MVENPMEWSGQLSQKPFLAVLRRILREGSTGTLIVSRGDEIRRFFFVHGELRTAKSSQPDHRIGIFLKSWGHISEEQLQWALNVQKETGKPLYAILVESGTLTSSQFDSEAKRLMEMIVFSTLTWSDGVFHFQSNPSPDVDPDIAFTLSAAAVILEGIRRMPESDRFLQLLGDTSKVPVLVRDPSQDPAVALTPEVAYFFHLIAGLGGEASLSILIERAPFPPKSTAKTLYALIYSGFVELRSQTLRAQQPSFEPPSAFGPDLSATLTDRLPWEKEASDHRKLVLETYRRTDWTSYYDLLGVPPDAGREEIEEAYRSRRVLFDPDLHTREDLAGCKRQLQVVSARLALAHETLVHPAKRNAYDEKLRAEEALIERASETGKGSAKVSPSAASAEIREKVAHQNYLRAKELIEKKDYFPAIQMLQEAVRLVPKHGEYRYLLNLAQMKAQLEEQGPRKPEGGDGQSN